MTSTLFKKQDQYFCSNCMMRQPRVQASCFWCGNMFSNYENMLIQDVNDNARALLNIDPITDKNKFAKEEPDIIIGGRWYETPVEEVGPPLIDEETWNKLVSIVRRKEDESDIHRRD